MLLSCSRSLLLIAAVVVPAAFLTTSCNKTQAKPEVRLARTTATGTDGSLSTNLTADANSGFAPGAGWSPTGAPPESSIGSDGTMKLAGNTRSAMDTAKLDETGSLANTASTDGVEGAEFASELQMVHFEYDSAEIAEAWKTTLNEHAAWINQRPEMMVQIEGHCDERGTEEYNVSLGQRRADTVRTYLVEQGVDANRLSTISYGKMRPLSFDATEEAHGLNRRAMFLVYKSNNNTLASATSTGF
ncbi:peptidoglycan-associated lipoprotein Pal [bacterium]|nr:peptidoglycan-associated lipoprotein Pal [bacterium]